VLERLKNQMAQGLEEAIGDRVAIGDTARMRARLSTGGSSSGSNITATLRTSGVIVAWCSNPTGIQAACCGGSR
jgi:exosome complex RNA-binding protein Csl4